MSTDLPMMYLRPLTIFFAATLLAACAGLPEGVTRPVSQALPGQATTLAHIAAAGRPASAAGLSGFRLLPTANYAFNARIDLARRAEQSIDAQYYLLQDDTVGKAFLRALRDAAGRGVRVRLLVDDLYAGGEADLLADLAAAANVEVRLFNPLPARSGSVLTRFLLSWREFGRINHRMHNKLFIADNALSVSGGRNIADEYFMTSPRANFIDLDVLSSGPVVGELSAEFDRYWNSRFAYPVESLAGARPDAAAAQQRFAARVGNAQPVLPVYARDPLLRSPVEQQLAEGRLAQTFASARVFADDPAKVEERGRGPPSAMMRNTLEVIGAARREVVIISPYFIPGEVGMPMMRTASKTGVRTVVFTNALGATDEPLVHRQYARYRREMLELGVELYEISPTLGRDSGGFGDFGRSISRLHAKAAVIDRRFVFIGSMNLDGRSAIGNTELGLVIDSEPLAESLLALMQRDNYASVLRVRLAANRHDLEWVAHGRDGHETVYQEEPDDGWWLRFKLFLLAPFASEELL